MVERQGIVVKFTFCNSDGNLLLVCHPTHRRCNWPAVVLEADRFRCWKRSFWNSNLCFTEGECVNTKDFNLFVSCLFNNRDSDFLEIKFFLTSFF